MDTHLDKVLEMSFWCFHPKFGSKNGQGLEMTLVWGAAYM